MSQELDIESVGHGGDGLGRMDGQVCFVPGALPGDRVELADVRRRKGVARARLGALLNASPDRRAVECPVYEECGGCNWLHFRYPAQLEWKQRIVEECFRRIGGLDVAVEAIEDPELRLGYRTRAAFHGDGERWGFYRSGSHTVVDLAACPLCHPHLNDAFARLREVRAVGSVEITVNPEGNEVLVWCDAPADAVKDAFPEVQSRLDGGKRTGFVFDGIPIVNGAFSQSSLLLNRQLVATAHEAAGAPGSLLDLYCGTGNFSLGYGNDVAVVGMDHNGISIMAADRNGAGEYRIGDEAAMRLALHERAWDVILLDPPRTGVRKVAAALAKAEAGAIVYVSCDPAALARDAGLLARAGWKVTRCVMVDMFPNSAHIETVCKFER